MGLNVRSFLAQSAPLLITALLAGASYWVAVQSERGFFGQDAQQDPRKTDYFVERFRSEEHQILRKQHSVLTGIKANHIPEGNLLLIDQPKATRFESQGVILQAQSERARLEMSTDVLHMMDNVVLVRDNGRKPVTLRSEAVDALFEKDLLRGELPTVIKTEGRTLNVQGFEMDTRSGDFQSLGKAHVTLEAKN